MSKKLIALLALPLLLAACKASVTDNGMPADNTQEESSVASSDDSAPQVDVNVDGDASASVGSDAQ